MTAGVSYPRSYVDFSRRPSEFAQTKFSDKFWKEALGYISAIAFAALALIVNTVLLSVAAPYEFVVINTCFFTAGYSLIAPLISSCFAGARKLQAQGEKEMAIDSIMTDLQRTNDDAFNVKLREYDIQTYPAESTSRQADSFARNSFHFDHLLARVIYYDNRSVALKASALHLKGEGKFIESVEAELAASRAKVKAAFFSSLIPFPGHLTTKFKDAFKWTVMPLGERLARQAAGHPSAHLLVERNSDARKVLSQTELNGSIGEIGRKIYALLPD